MPDWLRFIEHELGSNPWVPLYYYDKVDTLDFAYFYTAVIPNSLVPDSLETIQWDLQMTDNRPGFVVDYHRGKERATYYRLGRDDGIEPLVIGREFYGVKPAYQEIAEEFRLFHNLYHDTRSNRYTRITDSGEEEDVVVCSPNLIEAKLKPLKQFLAVKKAHLAVFFSIDRYSVGTLEELGLKSDSQDVKTSDLRYRFSVGVPHSLIPGYKGRSFSSLFGKKLIKGVPLNKCGIWPFEEKKKFEEFIIGTDSNGDPVLQSCDPDELANYFGRNKGAPHYLTPVHFKREVLQKYYDNPSRYSIGDNYLRCRGLWILRIDNNRDKGVVVFLGDLGRDLPEEEQLYWKSFNVIGDGTLSETTFRRSFLGEWADPEKADLVFKVTFEEFQVKWEKKFSWPLFKPLREEDTHNFQVLRVPLTDEQHEFDIQVGALAKVLIDSVNDEEIVKRLPPGTVEDKRLNRLQLYLESLGLTDCAPHVTFLRELYGLRSTGVGHRKSKDWDRSAAKFDLKGLRPSEAFANILKKATEFLKYLDKRLLGE